MGRREAVARRVTAQQLDRPTAQRPFTDAAVLDVGVQDTGRDGASWALANRGVPVANTAELESDPDLALAWTLRSSPHFYRRADLYDVMVATSPLSERDATTRVFTAAAPLAAAGITTLDGLREMSSELRAVVDRPRVKGEVSGALRERLEPPHLKDCVPCGATHPYEIPFRIGALYAGLELEPGTSPPVLRRIPDWPRRRAGPDPHPLTAPARWQPIRNYLRFLGPATPQEVAGFLDAPVAEIKAAWPEDAVEVQVEGRRTWLFDGSDADPGGSDLVRLLGGFDLLLQGRDRALLVPDRSRHKALWPTIGRPGAVLVGTEVVGTWRPRAQRSTFTLRVDWFESVRPAVRARVGDEAERLAAHRGLTLTGIEE